MATRKPIVAAVHGSAIGAGLGLALVADFRVTCKESRLACNFAALGYHPGFGMTYTLPRLVGHQTARWLAFTGRRVPGDEAVKIGLADRLAQVHQLLARTVVARKQQHTGDAGRAQPAFLGFGQLRPCQADHQHAASSAARSAGDHCRYGCAIRLTL